MKEGFFMVWQKLPKPSTLWEEGEKWFELEDNLAEGKFDFLEYKEEPPPKGIILQRDVSVAMGPEILGTPGDFSRIDRKSTRLNSSHVKISYAVFCLKKKRIHI